MPELPDVEIFSRLVRDHCCGRTIARAVVSDAGIVDGIAARVLEQRLSGERIRSSQRYGKHLFIVLGQAGALAMHFGTNGSLQLDSTGNALPPYTRLQLQLTGGNRLAYVNPRRIGRVSLWASVDAFVTHSGLGPDALDGAVDLETFGAILGGSKRDIKTVLMDQALLAGIGNLYSDEILFQARLHPGLAANRVSREDAARLFRAMRKTLETAIRYGAGAEQAAARLPKGFLLAERHKGGHCPRCGTALAVAKHGGRTSYYCRQCQQQ